MTEWHRIDGGRQILEPDNRGFQYGDGVFETIAVRHGKPRLWSYHMRRLRHACERLGFVPPPEVARHIELALAETKQDSRHCIVKLVVTAANGPRGYARDMPGPTDIFIAVFPAREMDASVYRNGVATQICETRLAVGSPVAGIKTLNRLEQVLARSECDSSGTFEGFTLDAGQRLICGTMSNVFLVRNNRLVTPALHRCGVEGVMRQLVIDTCGDVEIGDLTVDDLAAADEVFITNSQVGAVPVCRCDKYRWEVGPTTRAVMRSLAERGIDECRL